MKKIILYSLILINILLARFVALKVPVGNFSPNPIEFGFIGLIIISIISIYKLNNDDFFRGYLLVFYIFLGYGLFSMFYGIQFSEHNFSDAFGRFRRFTLYPLIFPLVYISLYRIERSKIIQIFYIALTFIVLYGTARYLLKFDLSAYGEDSQLFAFFHHFEGWVALFFVYSFFLKIWLKIRIRTSDIFLALISFFIMILTLRRGLWVSSLIGLLLLFLLRPNLSLSRIVKVSLISISLFIISILIFQFVSQYSTLPFFDAAANRVEETIINFQNISSTDTGGSFAWRYYTYLYGLDKFFESPFIGHGMGVVSMFFIPGNTYLSQNTLHNSYLELLVNAGIVGLVLFLSIHFGFIKRFLKIKEQIRDNDLVLVLPLFVLYILGILWSFIDVFLSSNINFIIIIYSYMGFIAILLTRNIK